MFWVSYSRPGGQKHEGEFPVPSWVCATLSHHLFTMSWCHVSRMQGTEATPESPSGLGKNLKGLQKATEIAKVLGINGRGKPHYFIILRLIVFDTACGKKGLFNTLFNILLTLLAYTAIWYLDIFLMLMHPFS